jgi:hypothetical protein
MKKRQRHRGDSRYPKLTLLLAFSLLSYYIFSHATVNEIVRGMEHLSYLGIFIAGLFFSFGFTTPFAIGFFLVVRPENIYLAALIGGVGALIADLLIFKLIRFSFMDEFNRLKKNYFVQDISHMLSGRHFAHFKIFLVYLISGLIISSPLPDELGIAILAGLTTIRAPTLAAISLIMNTLGIFIMIFIGMSL